MSKPRKLSCILILVVLVSFFSVVLSWPQVAIAQDGEVIYEDDFSNIKSGWAIDDLHRYVNGSYQIEVEEVNYVYWAFLPFEDTGTFYSIESEMDLKVNVPGEYGFLFNYLDDNNFCIFRVDPYNQEYSVGRVVNGDWTAVVKWTTDKVIQQYRNTVKLVQDNRRVEVYVNDRLLESLDIGVPGPNPGLALVAGSYEEIPITAEFDNLIVRRPGGHLEDNSQVAGLGQDSQEKVIYQDQFSDEKSGWADDEIGSYFNGRYQVLVEDENYICWAYVPFDDIPVSGYSVTADMALGDDYLAEYGFVFNYVTDDLFSVYKVDPYNGEYCLEQYQDGNWTALIDWTSSPYIKRGENRVKLVQSNRRVELHINGRKVADYQLADQGRPVLALAAGSYDYTPVEAYFDNIVITREGIPNPLTAEPQDAEDLLAKMKGFSTMDYSLRYPVEWIQESSDQDSNVEAAHHFYDPYSPAAMAITVMEIARSEDFTEPLGADNLIAYMQEEEYPLEDGEELLDQNTYFKIDGRPAYNLVIGNFNGEEGEKASAFVTYKDEETLLIVIYVAREEYYEDYLDIAFAVIDSLEFNE
ncbi:MAG: hypothetical protein UMV23_05520 [Halanaerobium sp.]|nr:hypothetical protein [Halanaerobium sp.]